MLTTLKDVIQKNKGLCDSGFAVGTSSPILAMRSSTERGLGLQEFLCGLRRGLLYCGILSISTLDREKPPTTPRIAPRPWPPGVVAMMWMMSPFWKLQKEKLIESKWNWPQRKRFKRYFRWIPWSLKSQHDWTAYHFVEIVKFRENDIHGQKSRCTFLFCSWKRAKIPSPF